MDLRARLIASTLAAALCSTAAAAGQLVISTFSVRPAEVDGGAQVRFSGTVGTACADATSDTTCSGTGPFNPSLVENNLCTDMTTDIQCSVPREIESCTNAGGAWVYLSVFEGSKLSVVMGVPGGVCTSASGAFSGSLPVRQVPALTTVGIYAALEPGVGPQRMEADNPLAETGWRSVAVKVHPAASVASLSCAPAVLAAGQQATGTVTMSRPVRTTTTLTVSGSSSYLVVPSRVTIPAGAASATFRIIAGPAPAATAAKVKVVMNTGSKTCDLQVRRAS